MNRLKPHHTLLALFILTLSMLAACFWPFNFHPHNDVMLLPGEQGLRFYGYGTAYSRDSFPSLHTMSESNELTVDMTVRPKRIFNSYLPNILSFATGERQPALVIGAWKKSLVVRLGRPGNPGWKKYQEIGVGDVFTAGQTVHLVISLSPRGTTIYVDGSLEGSFPAAFFDTSNAPLGRLLLGNSLTGSSQWRGDLLSLAVYNRALTPVQRAQGTAAGALPKYMEIGGDLVANYRFDKMQGNLIPNSAGPRYAIVIPTIFSPLRRTVLDPPRGGVRLTLSSVLDIVLNILGFIPFGFLSMLYLGTATAISPRRLSTMAVLAGCTLSLFIELTQAFLPTRSSTLLDLATNTLGTAIGVLAFFTIKDCRTPFAGICQQLITRKQASNHSATNSLPGRGSLP